AAQRLDTGLGGGIAGFGCHVLRDRTLGVQTALHAAVDALRGFFDVGAGSFQADYVRHDQLVRVPLLFRKRSASLNAFGGVGNCPVERGPSRAQSKRGHHQPRVTEHGLCLIQPLAFDAANQPVGVDIDVAERKCSRVAQTNAVLVFRLIVRETLSPLLDDEPTRTAGCVGQYRVSTVYSAVADPLFFAIDPLADDATSAAACSHNGL